MSPFLEQAAAIFGTAGESHEQCDWAILLSPEGAIRVTDGTGWELEGLRLDSGAAAAYRVTRRAGGLKVEGRRAGERCVFESRLPRVCAPAPRPLLAPDFPLYLT